VNVSDLDGDRVKLILEQLQERLAAVTEIIKHVIDGDDGFRDADSDSGKPNENLGKPPSSRRGG